MPSLRGSWLLLLLGCTLALGALTACQATHRAPATTRQALDPILEDRPERLVDIDPTTLYSEEQLTPLLFLQGGALPATLQPLTPAQLATLPTDPRMAQIDLRLVHSPDRWPADARPPGDAQIVRASWHRDCEAGTPCARRVAIQAGQSLKSREVEVTTQELFALLAALEPVSFDDTREAHPDVRTGVVAQPWLELRILLQDSPDRAVVPRQELDAPRDALVSESLIPAPDAQPIDPSPPVNTEPRWVEADADGVPYMEVVDPGATLLTFTLSVPEDAAVARRLMPLATFVADHYLESGWDSSS